MSSEILSDINNKLIFIEKNSGKEFSNVNVLILENDFIIDFFVKNNDKNVMKNFSLNHSSNISVIKGELPKLLKPGEKFLLRINIFRVEGINTFFEVQSVPTFIEFS